MDEFQTFHDKVSELIGKSEALQQTHSFDVFIKETPTDWLTILATFGAAFFGALSAYLINTVHEYSRERDKRRTALNSALNSFVITLNTLVNFKNQFFVKFKRELDAWRDYAGSYYTSTVDEDLAVEFQTVILPMLQGVLAKDPSVNGAFQKWYDMEFNLYSPENLGFFLDSSPDDLRIFEQVREQLQGITRTIKLRNEEWDKALPVMHNNLLNLTPDSMAAIYQMLSYRSNIEEYVDTSLVLLFESIERIEKYREKHFPKRFILWRWMLPKHRWVKYKLPEKVKALIPDRNEPKYKNMIETNENWNQPVD